MECQKSLIVSQNPWRNTRGTAKTATAMKAIIAANVVMFVATTFFDGRALILYKDIERTAQ